MSRTYRAVLQGDHLEWEGPKPELEEPVAVLVTLAEHEENLGDAERGRRMAAALQALAEGGAFSEIPDPVAWQREMRRDRSLPGRDEA
jgi:hypothetical protein